jgi:hypothetical protein
MKKNTEALLVADKNIGLEFNMKFRFSHWQNDLICWYFEESTEEDIWTWEGEYNRGVNELA